MDTPIETNAEFYSNDGEPLFDPTLYRQLVGSPVYLIITQPYISYIIHIVSQFMSARHSTHFVAILRILR